ncbi:hypothetical protein HH214_01165 [Mucilaginibacter robiniae]|uniref:DUF4412 domain-containing protein n=1 Tax=Mucilaginibacter robiniae TaxID=2728022 RepID=A0A7L5DV45_9SPHI|nr:hypothetical protein [Mucilaginibacter robiniae]QJD94581.1 hypothetical protein HH214_01165 [Mucilaginibacter robiniae]
MIKTLFTSISLLMITCAGFAQKYVPQIKAGTVFNYTAYARNAGQRVPASFTLVSLTPPVQLKWAIPGFGNGMYEISAKGVQSGTKMAIKEPGMDPVTKLKDDETMAFLSKDTFNSLVNNKTFTLNKQTFNVVADTSATPYKINDKEADVFYAITSNGKTKIWVLNNPGFPLICKMEGGPYGIDLNLENIQ